MGTDLDHRLVTAIRRAGAEADAVEWLDPDARQRHERAAIESVAEATDTPATTVQRRLRELEDEGALDGYTPRLDYERLGHGLTVLVRLAVDGLAVDAVCARLADEGCVTDVYQVTGPEDVIAVGRFADREVLDELLARLLADAEVRAVHTEVVGRTVQDAPFALPFEE